MLQEHTGVVFKTPHPELGLDSGSSGMVVHVHGQGAAYEVEFLTQDGHTVCVERLKPEDLALAPLSAIREDARQNCLTAKNSAASPSYLDQLQKICVVIVLLWARSATGARA